MSERFGVSKGSNLANLTSDFIFVWSGIDMLHHFKCRRMVLDGNSIL